MTVQPREVARRVRASLPPSDLVGPYEREGIAAGVYEEQWLWQHRDLIRGRVLDMSTPRHFHDWIYDLRDVDSVEISDLAADTVTKLGHASSVTWIGDFCGDEPPAPAGRFDTALCISILEHCVEPRRMVANLARVVRPGGHVFLMAPFAYIDGHMEPDYWRFCVPAYGLLARGTGLEVVHSGANGDLGEYLIPALGVDGRRREWHRGVPIQTWAICRRSREASANRDKDR